MDELRAENMTVSFPSETGQVTALDDVNLGIQEAEFVVALGASGCGKTTLLNALAGFLTPTSGRVLFNNVPVEGPGQGRSVVFQKHALLPWLNVIDNVAFGLEIQGYDKKRRREVAREYLGLVGLDGFENNSIYQLSGGMQQRVGVARALATDPSVLLMDEPFAALDALTRDMVQEILLRVWSETHKMVFFITHSIEEALFLGTKLVVMSPRPGRITHTFDLDFSKRFAQEKDGRAIKSSSEFIEMREKVLGLIYGDIAEGA